MKKSDKKRKKVKREQSPKRKPCLILVVGPPCHGKTFFVKNHLIGRDYTSENTVTIHRDDIFLEFLRVNGLSRFSDMTQEQNTEVLIGIYHKTMQCLSDGLNVIYDSTNHTILQRKAFYLMAQEAGVNTITYVVECKDITIPLELRKQKIAAGETNILSEERLFLMSCEYVRPDKREGAQKIRLYNLKLTPENKPIWVLK